MNWGYKIGLVYISFITGIGVLAYKSSSEKVDLVTKDYYQQELKYEQKIDAAERAQSLSSPVLYGVIDHTVEIRFPREMDGKMIDAQALLYCPSDAAKDSVYHLRSGSARLVVVLPKEYKGLFELKTSWKADTTSYYSEHKFVIK